MASERANLILNPVRLRILGELAGRTLTTTQLGELLPDLSQATLYRHVKTLLENNIIAVASETRVNGAVERTYTLVNPHLRLEPEDLRSMTHQDHQQTFAVYTAALLQTFDRFVSSATQEQLGSGKLRYQRGAAYLTDEEFADFSARLSALTAELFHYKPAPGRKRYVLASVVIPEREDEV
jgi:DNA-binding transcriptional ArsR family regulator